MATTTNYCFETLTINAFLKKVNQPNFKDLVFQEFKQLATISLKGTTDNFSKKENSHKNRWYDIPCWDHSRVILTSHGSQIHNHSNSDPSAIIVTNRDSDSTYIHANFVDGYEEPSKFICCQAPKEITAGDFWKLIWQEDVHTIVSLTETDEGDICFEYWVQEEGFKLIFGRYVIETLEIKEEVGFVTTRLRLTDITCQDSRIITHFWYVNWPNYGVPTHLEEFVTLLTEVNEHQRKLVEEAELYDHRKPGPIVVHCSAGVGRTGSFCSIDYAIDQLNKENTISLQNTVLKIREMRHSSVVTPEQYMFLYNIIEYLLPKTKQDGEGMCAHTL
ncbi:tyrosine-protein phosphatase non-receptor type 9-like [Cydia pomonella]|uniref:tyrosine-protein phosphatase non-receptor type 9-like n=1 Tax=Cydia pomonella TaxID=82600 RepID=UPI002ADD4BFB|nr:tyrosine-protein phosphatase non-receptor type 9-like [Cydia pomonella]